MYTLVIHEEAEKDIEIAYKWYEQQRAGLGQLFLGELVSYYQKLTSNPLAYSQIGRNRRQAILHKFPFVIVFRVKGNEVQVFSIFHTSRNPKKKPGQ